MAAWYEIQDTDNLFSPALLFYPERIARNIESMIALAGKPARLRPHVKTYKCAEVVHMQMERGIHKFKCATLAEAKMLAGAGAEDILIAYPLVGPAQTLFQEFCREFPNSRFSALVDHPHQLGLWEKTGGETNLFIDLDVGMHRTGIAMHDAGQLYEEIATSRKFNFRGWHVYDGHIHDKAVEDRKKSVSAAMHGLGDLLNATGTASMEIICGGSITFPIHAEYPQRTLAPGTTLLWDRGYASQFPDLPFVPAAALATRVISKPGNKKLCLDLGHKAVASEMKKDPVFFPQLPDAEIVVHSEEHLVVRTGRADNFGPGDVLYGIPWHICPTVALHAQAAVIEHQEISNFWDIGARNRIYNL